MILSKAFRLKVPLTAWALAIASSIVGRTGAQRHAMPKTNSRHIALTRQILLVHALAARLSLTSCSTALDSLVKTRFRTATSPASKYYLAGTNVKLNVILVIVALAIWRLRLLVAAVVPQPHPFAIKETCNDRFACASARRTSTVLATSAVSTAALARRRPSRDRQPGGNRNWLLQLIILWKQSTSASGIAAGHSSVVFTTVSKFATADHAERVQRPSSTRLPVPVA